MNTPRTRVLHVISGLGTGGAEAFLSRIAPGLDARGIGQSVVSLTGDGPAAADLEAAGIPVVRLDARHPAGAIRAIRDLARLMRTQSPDVVQGWMYHGDLFAALAHRLAGDRSRRLYWGIRCSDMNLADYSVQLKAVVRACIWLSRLPDAVIANSAAGARAHRAAGYKARQMLVVPNGIDITRFAPDPAARARLRDTLGIGPDEIIVVHVARVDPMKDHAGLLAAFARIRGARLLLLGSGTEGLAKPPTVIGLGRRSDVAHVLAAGDVVVSSSAYGEGFSNAIAEGMAVGLTPVATEVGDAAEIIGETGSLVAPRDPPALAAALQRTIDLEPGRRQTLGEAARQRIAGKFSLAQAVERFEALYRHGAA